MAEASPVPTARDDSSPSQTHSPQPQPQLQSPFTRPPLQQQQQQQPQPYGEEPSKRRKTAASSRGVANLTPEQLARKRANDREAQRAIRERTKAQIDRLNQRIRELESQPAYHELQLVVRQKEAIQAENEEIRRRLAAVMAMLQPIVSSHQGLNDLADAAERNPFAHPPTTVPPAPDAADARIVHFLPPVEQRPFQGGVTAPRDGMSNHASPTPSNPLPSRTVNGQQWDDLSAPPTSNARSWHAASPLTASYNQSDERLGVGFLLDGGQRGKASPIPPGPSTTSALPLQLPSPWHDRPLFAYAELPRTLPPTCPLDTILLEFLAERKQRAAEGVPPSALTGPTYPNFTALVRPGRDEDSHPLSKVFTDILRTFPNVSGLPEQVAVLYLMFLLMRWEIDPTEENYNRLPDWLTPRPSQLFSPHPVWMDHLPWPRMRDRLVQPPPSRPFVSFDSFFIPLTANLSVNWPHPPSDCLLPASRLPSDIPTLRPPPPPPPPQASSSTSASHSPTPAPTPRVSTPQPLSTLTGGGARSPPPAPTTVAGVSAALSAAAASDGMENSTSPSSSSSQHQPQSQPPHQPQLQPPPVVNEEYFMNPAFEEHLRDLRNWSVGPAFAKAFPELMVCGGFRVGL